jgi:hypothetical protein
VSGLLPTAAQTLSAAGAYRAQYNLAFQVSPIILQGGIAASAQGGLLPIIALYGQLGLFGSTTTDENGRPTTVPPASADQFFAQYMPLPGSTLINNAVGMYPFANQQVAANAIIQQPLTLSMLMIAPVNQPGGYLTKLSTFTALQGSLQAHSAAGGTFSVATPAFVFSNLIMTGMTDITHGDGNQPQIEWQLDFIQPLLTIQAAAAAQSALMAKISSGGQINGTPAWSGSINSAYVATAGLTGAVKQFGGTLEPAAPVINTDGAI